MSGSGLSVSETFGTIAQVPGEPGVLLATNANGDALEIIWPARTASGTTATFNASASNLLIPALKL